MKMYKKKDISRKINNLLLFSYSIFCLAGFGFSNEVSLEKTLKTYVLAPVSGMGSKDFQREVWKKSIDSFVYAESGIASYRNVDLGAEKKAFLHGEDNQRENEKDRRVRNGVKSRSDRRQDMYFPVHDKNLKKNEKEAIDYIEREIFSIYEKVLKETEKGYSKMEQIEKVSDEAHNFVSLWLSEKDNIPKTLYKQIALIEKFLFKQSFTETIMHELKDLSSDDARRKVSMLSFGIAMSELNSAGGYNFADLVRNSQVRFFNDVFGGENRVLLAFNKMVVFGLKESLSGKKTDPELNDMSIIEYLNLNGFNSLPDKYKKALEEELSEEQVVIIKKKYKNDLKTRLETEINNKSDFSAGKKERWKKDLGKLAVFSKPSGERIVNFDAFTREFSGLHSKILRSLDQVKGEESFVSAKNEIFRSINSEIKDDAMKVNKQINFTLQGIFGAVKFSKLSEQDVDEIRVEDYNKYMEFVEENRGKEGVIEIEDINDFKKMLKNLIKRRRYIQNDIFAYLNKYNNEFKQVQDLDAARSLLDDMIFEKAKEVQARVFNEFEGRSKGFTYYYEEMIGLAEIPDEIFWHNKGLDEGLPDQDRFSLIEAASKGLENFKETLNAIKEKNIFDDRHHKFISKEFFHIICEQCHNKRKNDIPDEFYDKFGYLWGTDYPLMANIGGDELHISFKGPDGKDYPLSFDFNNFQGCDLLLRNLNGAPYTKDELLFNIHESIVTTLREKINYFREEFKNDEESKKTFPEYYRKTILPEVVSSVPNKVKVELNPFEFNGGKLFPHEQHLKHLTSVDDIRWNDDSPISEEEKQQMKQEVNFNLVKITFNKRFTNNELSEISEEKIIAVYQKAEKEIISLRDLLKQKNEEKEKEAKEAIEEFLEEGIDFEDKKTKFIEEFASENQWNISDQRIAEIIDEYIKAREKMIFLRNLLQCKDGSEAIGTFLEREFNIKDGKIKSPKLSLSLKFFFFPGLSKTKYSGRMLKGKLNNVQLAAMTMLPLSPEKFKNTPAEIFYSIQDWLDKRLGEIKKNNKFKILSFNQNDLNETNDSEFSLDSFNENIDNANLKKQQEVLEDRKNYFDLEVLKSLEDNSIFLELYKDSIKDAKVIDAKVIKCLQEDLQYLKPFSARISEFLYRTVPKGDVWDIDVRGWNKISIYDKEYFTEDAVKEHLKLILIDFGVEIDVSEKVAGIIVEYGKTLQVEFNQSQRGLSNNEAEYEVQTAA